MIKQLFSIFLIVFSLLTAEGSSDKRKKLSERFFGKQKTPPVNAISSQLFKPGKSKNYFWLSFGTGSGNWLASGGSIMTYTNTGKLSVLIDTVAVFGPDQITKQTFSYDSQDRETQVFYEQYDEQLQQWKNLFRIMYTYDQIGLLQELVYEQWLNGNWIIQGGFRDIRNFNAQNRIIGRIRASYDELDSSWVNEAQSIDYQYDGQNRLISYTDQEWDSTGFVNSEKVLIQYGVDNKPNEATFQEWNGSSFVDSSRITDLQWYFWEGILETSRPLSYIEQKKSGNNWVNFEKGINTYLPNNSDIRLAQRYSGNQWVDFSRGSTINDDQQNPVFQGDEEYNAFLSRWDTLANASFYANLYDSQGRILEIVSKRMDMISMPDQDPVLAWINSSKKQFSQHQVFTENNLVEKSILSLVPNPVQAGANFQLNSAAGRLSLFDVQGRLVFEKIISENEAVSTSSLKPGLYQILLQDFMGKKSHSRLLVNQ